VSCPLCEKRPPKRFCPAKGEKICPVCCGRDREITIDCPVDCSHLIAAHRYEAEHRKPLPGDEFPYRDVHFAPEFVYVRWPVVTAIATAILGFQAKNKELTDASVLSALEALAETFRTLDTGIYYEHPPDAPVARALYGHIALSLQELRNQQTERGGSSQKDVELFQLLVFLFRVGKQGSNGRSRTRAFLGFLRTRFPLPESSAHETSRIIMP